MRIKKAPLRAPGMEGLSYSQQSEAAVVKVSASVKTESIDYYGHLVKVKQQRADGGRKTAAANHMDEETEAAKEKLRQQEMMGHIKVEMDEVSGACGPSTCTMQARGLALHCPRNPVSVAGLCRHP